MIIRLVKRSKPNIKVKIKPYAPQTSPKEYELSLLKIYQQGKEDYYHGKTNTN
nr:MAG TPA: hypothetical protein [Bacteriophage sp.]